MLQEYQYEIGPEDYLAYHKYHFAHDSRIRTRVTLLRAISALALLAIGLILNIKGHVNTVSIAVFAVLAVCAWMLVPQWMQDGAYKTAEKKYAPRIQPYQAVTTMQEDGLHIWNGEETQVLLYDSIEDIGEDDAGYIFLGYGDHQTVVIPPRAFIRGMSEREGFLSELRHMVHKRRQGVQM